MHVYIGPFTPTSNMLHNIQTDAALTSLPGPPTHTTDERRSMLTEATQATRPSLKGCEQKSVCIIHVNFYLPHRQQWKVALFITHECVWYARFYSNC